MCTQQLSVESDQSGVVCTPETVRLAAQTVETDEYPSVCLITTAVIKRAGSRPLGYELTRRRWRHFRCGGCGLTADAFLRL